MIGYAFWAVVLAGGLLFAFFGAHTPGDGKRGVVRTVGASVLFSLFGGNLVLLVQRLPYEPQKAVVLALIVLLALGIVVSNGRSERPSTARRKGQVR